MKLKRITSPPPTLQTSRSEKLDGDADKRARLIECLLNNDLRISQLEQLREGITAAELSNIIQRIYDLNEKYILELSAVEGVLRTLNNIKNNNRNHAFYKKIRAGFRDLNDKKKKVILAEGDSWFNYPIILTDIIDRIGMEKDFALYSLASGGDWFLSMLTGRQYVEELSLIYPDVFLISGGGNDIVGSRRMAAIVDPKTCDAFAKCDWAQRLMSEAQNGKRDIDYSRFNDGVKYLSRDFFALLMFFHLQYYFLISGVLGTKGKPGKFCDMQIITQGYDFALPRSARPNFDALRWYIPIVRRLGDGSWLKKPLLLRGIGNADTQRNIVYAMIYLFNEMMIEIGMVFDNRGQSNVYHIDSRNFVGENGWADELHAKPEKFMKIGEVFIKCIREFPHAQTKVYIVNQH